MGSLSDSQANGDLPPPPAEAEPEPKDAGAQEEEGDTGEKMEGVASIALLPSGAISGHFIRLPDSVCYGLQGTRKFLSPFTLIVLTLEFPDASIVSLAATASSLNRLSCHQNPHFFQHK
jgi:hypothetical protein